MNRPHRSTYSQFGEDLLLSEFFTRQPVGYYVEVGANDGLTDSNTALLEARGWTGILIEANPALIDALRINRPNSIVVHAAAVEPEAVGTVDFYQVRGGPPRLNGLSTLIPAVHSRRVVAAHGGRFSHLSVPAKTLEEILKDNHAPRKFDLLSLDVEGAELPALRGLSFTANRPRLLIVEDNSGGQDRSVHTLLKLRGYCRVHRTGVNDWYVRNADRRYFWKQRVGLAVLQLKLSLRHKLKRLVSPTSRASRLDV